MCRLCCSCVSFPYYNNIYETINFQKERLIWGHNSQGSSPEQVALLLWASGKGTTFWWGLVTWPNINVTSQGAKKKQQWPIISLLKASEPSESPTLQSPIYLKELH